MQEVYRTVKPGKVREFCSSGKVIKKSRNFGKMQKGREMFVKLMSFLRSAFLTMI